MRIIVLLLILGFYSCESYIIFNSESWINDFDDSVGFNPKRDSMLADLRENYLYKGIKKDEVFELLGKPDYETSESFTYLIYEKYGWDIDPTEWKHLEIHFSQDSLVSEINVILYNKGKEI